MKLLILSLLLIAILTTDQNTNDYNYDFQTIPDYQQWNQQYYQQYNQLQNQQQNQLYNQQYNQQQYQPQNHQYSQQLDHLNQITDQTQFLHQTQSIDQNNIQSQQQHHQQSPEVAVSQQYLGPIPQQEQTLYSTTDFPQKNTHLFTPLSPQQPSQDLILQPQTVQQIQQHSTLQSSQVPHEVFPQVVETTHTEIIPDFPSQVHTYTMPIQNHNEIILDTIPVSEQTVLIPLSAVKSSEVNHQEHHDQGVLIEESQETKTQNLRKSQSYLSLFLGIILLMVSIILQ